MTLKEEERLRTLRREKRVSPLQEILLEKVVTEPLFLLLFCSVASSSGSDVEVNFCFHFYPPVTRQLVVSYWYAKRCH